MKSNFKSLPLMNVCIISVLLTFSSCSRHLVNNKADSEELPSTNKTESIINEGSINRLGSISLEEDLANDTISNGKTVTEFDPMKYRWKNRDAEYDDLVFLEGNKFSIMRTVETASILYGSYKIMEGEKEIILFDFEINAIDAENEIKLIVYKLGDKDYKLVNEEYNLKYNGEEKEI